MLYRELIIGGESYKLKLTTKNSVALERSLGYNPISMLMEIDRGKMPKLGDILIIFQSMLQKYHHGIDANKTIEIFDAYVEEGNSMFDLIPIFVEVFEQSGYISKPKEGEASEEEGKN